MRHRSCPSCGLRAPSVVPPLVALLALASLASSPAAARSAGRGDKTGPVMVNFKIGPSVPIYVQDHRGSALDVVPAAAALQLEAGVAVDRDRSAYLVLPFEIHVGSRSSTLPFGGGTTSTFTKVIVPFGFQYDIAIPAVRGLYVYPRVSLGYVAYIGDFSGGIGGVGFSGQRTFHGGMFAPELGVKYVWRHLQVGLEPFSLPLHFFAPDANNAQRVTTYLDYRIHFSIGANF